jgi:WD40 repeat protein
MNNCQALTVADGFDAEASLAEWAAELADRLHRGQPIGLADIDGGDPRVLAELCDLIPTIRQMSELSGPQREDVRLGSLGDFRIIGEIGRGGMGVVYEAMQLGLSRRVALKVLLSAAALDPRHVQRFEVEARTAAGLHHPNIVPVYATGSDQGIPYYAMQFIEGRDLARVIAGLRRQRRKDGTEGDRRLPTVSSPLELPGPTFARAAAQLARQAADALECAHGHGVLHRDVKPSNLLIDDIGRLWITDFGLARIRGSLELTRTGDALGTPRYMSPEQAVGRRSPLDGRTDIYSLGATIYELLTLRPAFAGDDRLDVLRRIAEEEPIAPRRIDPTIPVDLETIVVKAMAKEPSDRYATAADMADDLGRFLDGRPIRGRRQTIIDRAVRWTRRHRGLVSGLVAAGLLLVVLLALGGWRYTALLQRHNSELEAAIGLARRHAREADFQRRLADRHFYASDLRLARRAIATRQFEAAQDLLDAIEPGPDGDDPRDFAWHYLRRLARAELVRFPEREHTLFGISLARDGRTLASYHRDATMVIWDVNEERPRLSFPAGNASNPRLSADGTILVAEQGESPGQPTAHLALWETRTGTLRARRELQARGARQESALEILARDRLVACTWLDETGKTSLRIWDFDLDPAKFRPRVVLDALDDAAFAPRANVFVTIEHGRPTIRDVSTAAIVRALPGSFPAAGSPSLSDDGRQLALRLGGDTVIVLATADGSEVDRYRTGAQVASVVLSPAGDALAAVDEAGLVHLRHRPSGRSHVIRPDDLDRRREPRRPVFSPDGQRLATTSHGTPGGAQPAAVWDVRTGRRVGVLPSPEQSASTLIFTPDCRSLLDDGGRSPRIWHFEPPATAGTPAGHADEAWGLAYSPCGKLLATGSDDTDEPRTIKLWDASNGKLIRGWNAGSGTVAALAFSPDARVLASAQLATEGGVRLWDVATGRAIATLSGHIGKVRTVAFSPDGLTLATAGDDKVICLWDVASQVCVRRLKGHDDKVRTVAFAPGGRTLASAGNDMTVRLWDIASGRQLQSRRGNVKLAVVAYAPDGESLASADEAGAVAIRDASSLDVERTIRSGEPDRLLALCFAPDGRSLATSGLSGVVRLWDALTGQELLTLTEQRAQVNGIAFAPSGLALAASVHDGSVSLWRGAPPTE